MTITRKTQIFAHRGANKEAAENTRNAFDLALQADINGLETDVQLTRDNIAVLFHDDDFHRIGLPDKRVSDFSFAELQTLDLAPLCKLATPFSTAMRLDDFVPRYRSRTRLLLEIKNRDDEARAPIETKVQQTLAIIGAHQGEQVLISSFHLDSLIYTHQCAPTFPLVFNMEPEHTLEDVRHSLATQPFLHGYCVHIATLNHALVELLRSHNKLIAVYTCNSAEQIQTALDLQVDILISDVPKIALEMRS